MLSGNSKLLSMSSIKRPYLRGKQTQILRGQQMGNGSAKMISMAMQFIIINLKTNIESIHYIYWLISTENDHRHHHKFIKYEKRLRKEGNMLGLPINTNQALPWVRSIQRQRSSSSSLGIQYSFKSNAVYYYQFKNKYRINSFLMQELKLYMA
jgi:hypothetical protein